MGVRVEQYEAFSGTHNPPLPDGNYLAVSRVPNATTCNEALWMLWDIVSREAQTLSVSAPALQDQITKDLLEDTIRGINRCFGALSTRIVSRANRLFSSTFGGPSNFAYEPYPIRWAGESRVALMILMKYVASLFQVPQVACNRLDNGIIDVHAAVIVRPLFDLKAHLMKVYFAKEVQGEVSPDELASLFRNGNLEPPLQRSLDDRRSTGEEIAARDQAVLGDESAAVAPVVLTEGVRAGVNVWTWVPGDQDWDVFGELLERMTFAGPGQVPGEPFPFSTEMVGSSAVSAQTSTTTARRRSAR